MATRLVSAVARWFGDRRATASVAVPPAARWVIASGLLSLFGDQVYVVALAWLVLQETGSPAFLGVVLACATIPRAVALPVGGAVADRYGPWRVLVAAACLKVLIMPALAVVLSTGHPAAALPVMVVLGIEQAVYFPAESSLVPHLVAGPVLQRVNGLAQTVNQAGNVVGPAVGGVAVGLVGGGWALGATACAYGLAACVLLPVRGSAAQSRSHGQAAASEASFLASTLAGMRHVAADRSLRWLLATIAAINVCFLGPFTVGVPVLVRHDLAASPQTFGVVTACFAVGTIAGAFLASRWADLQHRPSLVSGLVAAVLVLLGGLGLARAPWQVGVVLAAAGIGSGLVNVVLVTFLQRRSDKTMLGRVMSLVMLASLGLAPVSQLATGAIIQTPHTRPLFGGAALAGLLVVLPAARVLRTLLTDTANTAHAEPSHTL